MILLRARYKYNNLQQRVVVVIVVILLLVNSGYAQHKYKYTINQNSGMSKNFQLLSLQSVTTKKFRVERQKILIQNLYPHSYDKIYWSAK